MSVQPTAARLRRWLPALALLVASAALAAPASAATTRSAITSVGDPAGALSFGAFNNDLTDPPYNPANQVTISGTSDDTAGDQLTIYCVYTNSSGNRNWSWIGTVATGDGLDASGNFSKSFSKNQFNHSRACRLAALPSSASASWYDQATFSGPAVGIGWTQTWLDTSGTGGASRTPDYYASSPQLKGYFRYYAIGDCGIGWSKPFVGSGFRETSDGMWSCASYVGASDYTGSRSAMRVDGIDAYSAASAPTSVPNGSGPGSVSIYGAPGITYSYSVDPASGNVVISENQDLVKCQPASGQSAGYPANSNNCASLVATGVRLSRTITQDHEGRLATFADAYSSTDGPAHSLDVEYHNGTSLSSSYAEWKFPGQSYMGYGQSDTVTLPSSSTGTIYVHDTRYAEGPREPTGSISYATLPDRAVFGNAGRLVLQYRRTVPAAGAVTITQAYGQAGTQADIRALGSSAEDAWSGPTVTITGPANGSTTDASPLTVTGTATDNVAVASLKVNGQSVSVGSDGSWSAQVPMTPGANTITAIATDGAANTAQAQVTVGYTPPAVPLPSCIVPNVTLLPLAQALRVLAAQHCAAGKVTKRKVKTVPSGRVVVQTIDPGKVLRNGSKVDLVVSKAAKKRKAHSHRSHR
jgi:hypothetical protein